MTRRFHGLAGLLLPPLTHANLIRIGLFALVVAVSAPSSHAKDGPTKVDAELVLAVDVSFSMDREEQRLQRQGYVEALTSAVFLNALRAGPEGKIAVAYVEWAGMRDQKIVLDWSLIEGLDSARRFAANLNDAPFRRASRTSVSGAIDFAAAMFAGNGYNGARRIIDISGDGPNNNGRPVTAARDEAVAQGITINGLPLMIRPTRVGYMDIPNLDAYYTDCVIGGLGAFMIPVKDTKAFVEATRAKLVLDIARAAPSDAAQVQLAQSAAPRVSCMIGETLWQQRMGN